jgi:hypothetical protein
MGGANAGACVAWTANGNVLWQLSPFVERDVAERRPDGSVILRSLTILDSGDLAGQPR